MTYTRRQFFQHASAAAALGAYAPFGIRHLLDATALDATALDAWPEPDEAFLRETALKAIDEARRAGADFADIRLTSSRHISLNGGSYSNGAVTFSSGAMVSMDLGACVRAIVDGAWGFTGGLIGKRDAIFEAARRAVDDARINQRRHGKTLELAPAPRVENGQWETVIARDPFTVPLGEQREPVMAALSELAKFPEVFTASIGIGWRRCTTVFASTEGTVTMQRFFTAEPGGSIAAIGDRSDYTTIARLSIAGIRQGPLGFEALGVESLTANVRTAGERAVELAKSMRRAESAEVGRYDLVLAPAVAGNVLATTLASALDLPRALGYMANREGTSFAAPPDEMLGKGQVASKLITVRGDRTDPKGAATVGWDDEGVKPEAYTFVKDGVVADYHTTRETAPALAKWYAASGQPTRAHGTVRGVGLALPHNALPNMTMEPSNASTTAQDLVAGTKRGWYVESGGGTSDQQLLNTLYTAPSYFVRRIINGKLGNPVKHFACQFITPSFWKNADAIGGEDSAESTLLITDTFGYRDFRQAGYFSTMRAVPVHVRDVNVVNTGRTA